MFREATRHLEANGSYIFYAIPVSNHCSFWATCLVEKKSTGYLGITVSAVWFGLGRFNHLGAPADYSSTTHDSPLFRGPGEASNARRILLCTKPNGSQRVWRSPRLVCGSDRRWMAWSERLCSVANDLAIRSMLQQIQLDSVLISMGGFDSLRGSDELSYARTPRRGSMDATGTGVRRIDFLGVPWISLLFPFQRTTTTVSIVGR